MASKKGNKEINLNNLVVIKPITDNQKIVFNTWKKDSGESYTSLKKKTFEEQLKCIGIEKKKKTIRKSRQFIFNLQKK